MKERSFFALLCFVLSICAGNALTEELQLCPENCTSTSRGKCLPNGVCECYCPNQYHCFTGTSCEREYDPVYDWDSIDCHNKGYWLGNWTNNTQQHKFKDNDWYFRSCKCQSGWIGSDCSICANDNVCRTPSELYPIATNTSTCDRSVYIFKDKWYSCNITTPELAVLLKANASVSMHWKFPPPELTNVSQKRIGNSTFTLYNRRTGPPFVFQCEVSNCELSYDPQGGETILCPNSRCHCSSWCVPFVRAIVEEMHSTATIKCTINGTCTFIQEELSAFIPYLEMKCYSGECYNASYKPVFPKKPLLTKIEIIILSCVLGVFTLSVLISLILWTEHRHIKRIHWTLAEDRQPAVLTFENLSCTIRVKIQTGGPKSKKEWVNRRILDNATGSVKAGQILAVLGASGAGKTTFLDILTGRKNTGRVTGSMFVNGQPFWSLNRRTVGYVMQEDIMVGTLTCREHLQFAAMLRLPQSMPRETKFNRVENLLRDMGLSEVANTRIGTSANRGISGGEKKRLSIATELLAQPQILVLDEPTSGIDAHGAFKMVSLVKHIAETQNCTVVMSIHQPRSNIYALFDNLLLLAHGKMVYSGPASNAISALEFRGYHCPQHFNPADFLIDTVHSKEVVENLIKPLSEQQPTTPKNEEIHQPTTSSADQIAVNVSIQNQQEQEGNDPEEEEKQQLLSAATTPESFTPEPISSRLNLSEEPQINVAAAAAAAEDSEEFVTSYATQLWYISKRTLMNVIRNPSLMGMNYLLTITVSLLLGGLYWKMSKDLQHGGIQNRMGILFFMDCLLAFIALTSIDTFFTEREIFVRERANGCYRTSTYYFAKLLCDFLPQRIIPPLIMGGIVYFMVGLRSDTLDHFALFLLILVLLSLASTALCMAVSCLTPSVAVGNLVVILTLFFSLLFGGFLVMKSGMPAWLRWICLLSFFNYSYEGLLINELDGIWVDFNPAGHSITPINGRELLINMGMNANDLGFDVMMLAVLAGIFILVGYILLRFVVKDKR